MVLILTHTVFLWLTGDWNSVPGGVRSCSVLPVQVVELIRHLCARVPRRPWCSTNSTNRKWWTCRRWSRKRSVLFRTGPSLRATSTSFRRRYSTMRWAHISAHLPFPEVRNRTFTGHFFFYFECRSTRYNSQRRLYVVKLFHWADSYKPSISINLLLWKECRFANFLPSNSWYLTMLASFIW